MYNDGEMTRDRTQELLDTQRMLYHEATGAGYQNISICNIKQNLYTIVFFHKLHSVLLLHILTHQEV